ncbi:MAG: hypothetical protein Q9227_006431, partial [Pyrenula ochraceoflavens]
MVVEETDLEKLIKQLSATPTIPAQNAHQERTQSTDAEAALRANKEVFFFRLEREIEKVNVFYLQKEAEFSLRLKTLLDKKRMTQARNISADKTSASFVTLIEGLQQFDNDLNKLQQFVEVNEVAISKILKKWDKTSKSKTKELYLHRAVEIQPCFNRDVLRDLSDRATSARLDLEAWAEGENLQLEPIGGDTASRRAQLELGENNAADLQILQAATAGNLAALRESNSRMRTSPNARERMTRTFLAAVGESSEEALAVMLESGLVDLHAEDDINERNCLHEAAIHGRGLVLQAGLADGVDLSMVDIYGRIPLHYACLKGRVEMVETLLRVGPHTVNSVDHDNFTPLIHSIVRNELQCAELLITHQARIDPLSESDHVPLNLACQYGSIEVAALLLGKGARMVPDAEGLYPPHLVARSTHSPELLLLLQRYGANLNQKDKLYQWTPLFHAASEGRVQCLRKLLEMGVDTAALDEKGLSAMYYATWDGHLECMRLLWEENLRSLNGDTLPQGSQRSIQPQTMPMPLEIPSGSTGVEVDGIPDLSLPPPIIPLRRYGHNFLDTKTFISITFHHGERSILFFNEGRYPAARLTISSKMSDLIPRSVMLPIQEDSRFLTFQADILESFTIEFEIFPTFGSKVIAKSVALPDVFRAIDSSAGVCCLPLFDTRLRAIGQINFSFQVIKPYGGQPLEIKNFATYWKATSALDSDSASLITGSSLSGRYLYVHVQLTRDGVPVLYPSYHIILQGLRIPISQMTLSELSQMMESWRSSQSVLQEISTLTTSDLPHLHNLLASSLISLQDALAHLPASININLGILYPTPGEESTQSVGPIVDINTFADAILAVVFNHARAGRDADPNFMRSIIFSSHNRNVCTAMNWKQPNYPVFLMNELGAKECRTSMSIKDSARLAQSNNFMGLICQARTL